MKIEAAPTLAELRQQVSTLEGEIENLKMKLATEETNLTALARERTELVEKITLGEVPASKVGAHEKRIEEVETRIKGFNSLLARKQASHSVLGPVLRRVEMGTQLNECREQLEKLIREGSAIVARINSKLTELVTKDFPELDAIRDR